MPWLQGPTYGGYVIHGRNKIELSRIWFDCSGAVAKKGAHQEL
jgi:hypothetical protein